MIIQMGTDVDESRILWKHKESDEWERADIDDLIRAYENRPKGEWIKATGVAPPEFIGRYVCSNCGYYALMDMPYGNRQELSHYCPNCGTRMKEVRGGK